MTHRIEPGQVYLACSGSIRGPRRVQVVAHDPATHTVTVINHTTHRGEQDFPASYFHATPTTKAGKPRRTGYALEAQP